MRILVVDDDMANRRLFQRVLEHAGHQVVLATDVDEGCAALDTATWDVVVADIEMPGGGGPALLERIRAEERTERIAVIAVTAQAMQGDRERLLALGFDGYVSKPIDVKSFAATLAACADRSNAAPQATARD